MQLKSLRTGCSLAVFLMLSGACSSKRVPIGGEYGDYAEEKTTVLGTSDGEQIFIAGSGDSCLQVSDSLCIEADTTGSTWCEREGGPVDVIIIDGEVVEVVCYPPADDPDRPLETIDSNTEGDINIVQTANNTTVVFHNDLDGVAFEGDLSVDGNNVAIYGNGPENTIIDGDVTISGNNIRLRGVTITGDLYITLNAASVVLCRILGNVYISLNGVVFAENDVFGEANISMNNHLLAGNHVQGTWNVSGLNHTCDANFAFTDANENQWVEEGEVEDALTCP